MVSEDGRNFCIINFHGIKIINKRLKVKSNFFLIWLNGKIYQVGIEISSECPTCADAGGQACYTSQPSTWGSCGAEKTMGDPYCYAKSGSTYECYGCVSGCTYTGGECCKTLGSSCSTNDVCCGYDGTASGYNCVYGYCQDTADCTDPAEGGYVACSTSYWSLACLVPSAPTTTACCSCTVAGFTAGCLTAITSS